MNITTNAHIYADDAKVTAVHVGGDTTSIFRIGSGTELTIFVTGKAEERCRILDDLVVVIQDLRADALRQAVAENPDVQTTIQVPPGIEIPHERPFHLDFQPGCPACIVFKAAKDISDASHA